MPQVGNKKFPYTPKGMARAKQLREKLRNPAARPPMPSGRGRPQVTLPNGVKAPARGPGRGPLTFPPSRRPLPNKPGYSNRPVDKTDPNNPQGGVTPIIPQRTPPAFGRPSIRPITKPMPRPGRPSRPGRPGFGIRPFPQNYRPKPPNRRYK